MKKTFVILASLIVLVSCGGGEKKGDTKKEESSKTTDVTQKPEYQQGLDAIARTPICGTCHLIDQKNIGPAWRDVANKYPPDSLDYLVRKVQEGGTGVWGTTPMPANNAVPKEDVVAIVKYIFLLKNK